MQLDYAHYYLLGCVHMPSQHVSFEPVELPSRVPRGSDNNHDVPREGTRSSNLAMGMMSTMMSSTSAAGIAASKTTDRMAPATVGCNADAITMLTTKEELRVIDMALLKDDDAGDFKSMDVGDDEHDDEAPVVVFASSLTNLAVITSENRLAVDLMMAAEEGQNYFHAQPSRDQIGLERNDSGLIGIGIFMESAASLSVEVYSSISEAVKDFEVKSRDIFAAVHELEDDIRGVRTADRFADQPRRHPLGEPSRRRPDDGGGGRGSELLPRAAVLRPDRPRAQRLGAYRHRHPQGD